MVTRARKLVRGRDYKGILENSGDNGYANYLGHNDKI